MNDRFKFRVWDKENKKFLHHLSFDLSPNGILILNGGIEGKKYLDVNDTDRYILMQCTGLKDKYGKLIYEGDIVKQNKTIYCVTWGEGSYGFCDIRTKITYTVEDVMSKKQEVIGNIYMRTKNYWRITSERNRKDV